jgi:hypothetical protein
MENEVNSSRLSLWIVFFLSILLISLDSIEIFYNLNNIKLASEKVAPNVYENCFKIQFLSQVVFSLFSCLTGVSALIMSMGLLINYRFFTSKLMDTFLYYNYIIFGPYMLGTCILSLFYFNSVVYNCDKDFKEKNFNLPTFITILVCLIISFFITIGHSVYLRTLFLVDSIRDGPNGNKLVGKLFWKVALSRSNNNNDIHINRQTPNNV